ncbi:putative phage tail protein [Acetobacter orientalis]|uniref:putative phage tail protein n=1 Tax=Acetobacter orientalis TaxID=146474 RepID=UPI00386A62C6
MSFKLPNQDQYAQRLLDLLPEGKAWPRDTDTNLYKLFYSLAGSLRDIDDKALGLIPAAFPSTATLFLDEWLELFGLPDKCTTTASSDDDKRAQVVSRLTWTGESTVRFLQRFCETLGYTVEIKEWGGAVCGAARAGKQGCQSSDRFAESAITINILNDKSPDFLLCELEPIKPYVTLYVFQNGRNLSSI